MISNFDRKYWIGGSDARYVMAKNRNTKTWQRWFAIKCGIDDSMFGGNEYTRLGNVYEHPILLSINPSIHTDRQLIVPKYNLRVNYDGDYQGTIYEVKTHRGDKPFEISQAYYGQAQAEMFCYKMYLKDADKYHDWHIREHLEPFNEMYIMSYALDVEEYSKADAYERGDMEVKVDEDKIKLHKVKYDKGFISQYKANLKQIAKMIQRGDGVPW